MHFAVIGAGNMGCVYGGNLARIGQEVSLIDVWDAHVRAIQQDGLRMTGLKGSYTVRPRASTVPAEIQGDAPKAGRNDPCPCGSGKKYKKCHGA